MSDGERIVTRYIGVVDPTSLGDFVNNGGYDGLRRALGQMGAGRVLDEVARSRLRSRGGDGFDVATKWRTVCETGAAPKYVVCNAFDADQLAPVGRTLLERSPHVVLEGMIISAFAVGASYGVVYCRGEDLQAVAAARRAIEQAREGRFLGVGILESDFDFEVYVATHWGGFIGGEETAMLAAIAGGRAMPSQQPPYPAQSGLEGQPTLADSAETFSAISWIVANGGESYARLGMPQSTGTKMIALEGDVRNRTLVELPFGTTLRQSITGPGQGLATGKAIKAVHVGGPLGGCVPENLLDTPLDYEALREVGTMVGTGRLTVLSDKACMACYSHQVMSYLAEEACGKCVPCRVGTKRNATILGGIISNLGKAEDLDLVAELSQYMRDASLCNLGVEAPSVMLTSIKYFPDDFRQHIEDGSCPTGPCLPVRQYRYQRRSVL